MYSFRLNIYTFDICGAFLSYICVNNCTFKSIFQTNQQIIIREFAAIQRFGLFSSTRQITSYSFKYIIYLISIICFFFKDLDLKSKDLRSKSLCQIYVKYISLYSVSINVFSVSYIIHNPRLEWMIILDLLELFPKFAVINLYFLMLYIQIVNFILKITNL